MDDIIKKLICIRINYLDGEISVLSETGNPVPQKDTLNVYIARRQGSGSKSGGIIVINNDDKDVRGLWVNSSPAGFKNLAGKMLVNVFNTTEKTTVQPDGRVFLSAPSRNFSLWLPADEYISD